MKTKKNLRILNVIAMVLCLVMAFSMTAFADTTTNAAKVGDTEYATLAEAVKAVEKGAGETTITLLKDQTISGQMIGHQYVQNIVLDLGGHTLSSNGVTLTSYRSGTTLTVRNGTVSGNSTSGTLRGTYGGQLILGDDLTVKGAGGSATLVYLDNGKMDIAAENGVAFTGGKLDFKQSANVNNKMNVAASIGRTYFGNLENAFAAAEDGDTIKVEGDIALDKMITNTKKVTLDLNGKTITGTDNTTKNFSLIDNRGDLTITGDGKMTLTATVNSGWNRYSAVIANNPGGKLTVESGVMEHLGGTDMAYGIDNLTNGKGTYAETIINGGTIKSTYRGIRQFLNGVEAQNILTVNGGTIEGVNKSIWMQDPSKNANSGTLTVTEDAALKGDVYLSVTLGSTEWPVEVSIASAALQEGSEVITGNIPETYVLENVNGVYGVKKASYVASIGEAKYETLSAAITAAQPGSTITLLDDVDENVTVIKNLTIDGADKNYTGTMTVNSSLNVTIQNVYFVKGCITEAKGTRGTLTIKSCSFDGVDKSIGYAITQRGGDKLVIENSTAKNYGYGMLYIPSAVASVSVKDVEVENCTAAFNISYSGNGIFENVELNNVTYGLHVQNYGARTFTLNGCDFNCKYPIYVQNKGTATVTFKFDGENTFVTETRYTDKYAKLILAKNAVLTAPQLFDVTTNVEDYEVVYSNGAYSLVTGDARIVNGAIYDTLADAIEAAVDGDTVMLLKDITLAENTTIVIDKPVSIDLAGHTIYGENTRTATHNFLIDVKGGTLTASNGTIAMKHTGANMEWNGATTVIDVTAGGVLNLNGVTVQNQGGTDMNFAVHMNNWGEVTLNADNCVFDAPYCGVRVFNSGFDMNNVTITNSKLTGATRAFWVHNYLGDLDSTKHSDEAIKARLNLDIYGNNNTFEITGTAKSPIRYGFEKTVYFDGNGYQVVDSAESLQDAINNGSGNIILDGDINLGGSIVIP